MAHLIIDTKPQDVAQPLSLDHKEDEFRYTQTPKLKNALDKAGRDFRSDVVTVPAKQSTGPHRCILWRLHPRLRGRRLCQLPAEQAY